MKSGIYQILCIPTGKRYIGSSVNIKRRWSVHVNRLNNSKHHSVHLQRAWDKYGQTEFRFEIIEYIDLDYLVEREQFYLDTEQPFGKRGFNISPIAGSTLGAKRSLKAVEKMAARFRGKKLSENHRKKLSEASKGRRHSDETKALLRQQKLLNNPQSGRPMTAKQKAALLYKKGEEHPFWGREHSELSKNKMSETKSIPINQIDIDGQIIKCWPSAVIAAKYLGLRQADTIYRAANNPHRQAAGFYWSYVTERVTDRNVVS